MKKISDAWILNATIIVCAVIIASSERVYTEYVQKYFAYPSAVIASQFLGSSAALKENHDVMVPLSDEVIRVTSKCSAFGFFCLLSAILLINVIKYFPVRKIFMGIMFILPLAYGVTVIVNGCRIVCAFYAHRIGLIILPANFQAVIHQGVGIAVFLSTLILLTLLFEKFPPRKA